MTWNLLHLARMLKDAGGIPAHGNQRSEWDAGCRFDFPNPSTGEARSTVRTVAGDESAPAVAAPAAVGASGDRGGRSSTTGLVGSPDGTPYSLQR